MIRRKIQSTLIWAIPMYFILLLFGFSCTFIFYGVYFCFFCKKSQVFYHGNRRNREIIRNVISISATFRPFVFAVYGTTQTFVERLRWKKIIPDQCKILMLPDNGALFLDVYYPISHKIEDIKKNNGYERNKDNQSNSREFKNAFEKKENKTDNEIDKCSIKFNEYNVNEYEIYNIHNKDVFREQAEEISQRKDTLNNDIIQKRLESLSSSHNGLNKDVVQEQAEEILQSLTSFNGGIIKESVKLVSRNDNDDITGEDKLNSNTNINLLSNATKDLELTTNEEVLKNKDFVKKELNSEEKKQTVKESKYTQYKNRQRCLYRRYKFIFNILKSKICRTFLMLIDILIFAFTFYRRVLSRKIPKKKKREKPKNKYFYRTDKMSNISTESLIIEYLNENKKQKKVDLSDQHEHTDCILLVHGFNGSSHSNYIKSLAQHLKNKGYTVYCFNSRGTKLKLRTPIFYHIGWTDDVKNALDYILKKHTGNVSLIGFSLGGNWITKLFGEDRFLQNIEYQRRVVCGMAVSLPFDFKEINEVINQFKYISANRYVARNYRNFLLKNKKVLQRSKINIKKLKKYNTVEDIDFNVTAKIFNIGNIYEHYTNSSCSKLITNIKKPFLVVNSRDDPIIPIQTIPIGKCLSNPNLILALTSHGGHIGFLSNDLVKNHIENIAIEYIEYMHKDHKNSTND